MVLEQLYTIVNTRYEDGKAMVLTTNLDKDALEAQIGARTVSRLSEMCGLPLRMAGDDQRILRSFESHSPSESDWRDDDAFWEGAEEAPRYGAPRARPLD